MRLTQILLITLLFPLSTLTAQNVGVGTNTPNASAALDVSSSNKGILIPRMPAAQRLLITPVDGLMVYDTDSSSLFIYELSAWKRLRAISNLQTLISGVSPDDVLIWNGTNWVVTPKCSLFTYYFRDADGDGKGDKYRPVYGCTILPGFVADSTDCDDTNPSLYPGAPEICNGLDDDCDGITDEGCIYTSLSGNGSGTITSTPSGINCGGDCNESFGVGNNITLTAAAAVGSNFTGWSGACTGTGACVVATPNAATSVTATFTLQQFTLTQTVAGNGSGTVTSTPSGINCGGDCSELYNYGTVVTLTATPSAGSTFSGWSGAGCSGTGPCNVTMDMAKTVTATFTLQQFTLTQINAGNGSGTVTSSPSGINCGADCSEVYNYGTTVTLTAAPGAGSTFTGWSGGGCSGTGPCVVTMTAATSVTATFTLQQFTLTQTKTGTGTGTVTSSPSGINCGVDCSEAYNYGTVVTLTAVPSVGSSFTGWSGGGCTGTGTCNVNMTSATSVTATFIINSYTLTVAKAGSGTGTVTSSPSGISCGADCSESYPYGTVVTLTANATTGSFAGWSGGGCTGTGTCVVNITNATTVTATFSFPEPEPSPMALHRNIYYREGKIELSDQSISLKPGAAPVLKMFP